MVIPYVLLQGKDSKIQPRLVKVGLGGVLPSTSTETFRKIIPSISDKNPTLGSDLAKFLNIHEPSSPGEMVELHTPEPLENRRLNRERQEKELKALDLEEKQLQKELAIARAELQAQIGSSVNIDEYLLNEIQHKDNRLQTDQVSL